MRAYCPSACLLFAFLVCSAAQGQTLVAWAPQQDPQAFQNNLAPRVGSPQHAVDKILEVANLKAGETLYDLGCGDGRILIAAAQRFRVNAVGIEISEASARTAVEKAKKEGVQNRVKVIHGDFMKTDLSAANVVTLYLATAANDMVRPHLERDLKPNSRVVSYDYPIPGWKAVDTFETEGHSGDSHVIYLYQVPASIISKK